MIKKIITATTAIVAFTLLTACQSAPEPVALNPQVTTTATGNQISLRVRDQRAHNHVMRLETDQTAEFATADPSLASLISDRIGARWTIVEGANAHLEVVIVDALYVIKQGSLRHDTVHNIRLQTTLTTPETELDTTFRGSRESNGPLRADLKRIEREFAVLLADVLEDVVNDDNLTARIQSAQ